MARHRYAFNLQTIPTPLLALSIVGCGRENRKGIQCAIEWMLTALLGKRLTANIELRVQFLSELEGSVGDCEWIDNNIAPRKFLIRISQSQSKRQQLITLAHELVHLKQFATNQLFDYAINSDLSRWQRRKIDSTKYAYRDLPWEQDAYTAQQFLFHAYRTWAKRQCAGVNI